MHLPSYNCVWMWKLNHKEGWALKNWCFWIVVLEKTLESPLDCKEVKPVSPKGNQPWIVIGRTDGEIESPVWWSWSSNTLATWCEKLIHWKRKTLMLAKIEGKRRRVWQKIRWLDHITDSVVMNLSKLWKIVKDWEAWCVVVHEVTELGMTWQLNNNSILQAKIHFTLSSNFPLNIFSGAHSYIVLKICVWACFLSK